jgi:hypothetical protein
MISIYFLIGILIENFFEARFELIIDAAQEHNDILVTWSFNYECNCTQTMSRDWRGIVEGKLLKKIGSVFDKKKPIALYSFGSGIAIKSFLSA